MKKCFLALFLVFYLSCSFAQRWEHVYGYPGTDESFKDIIECYDKGYLITGSYEQEEGSWLIKTDINGEIIWDKVLKWEGVLVFNAKMAQDNSGNIYITSIAYSETVGYWPMITKLDSCGEKVWCRVFADYEFNYGWFDDVLILENGDVLALGYLDSNEETELIFLYYITPDGNLLWRNGYASRDDYPLIRESNGDGIKKYGNHYMIHGHCYYPYPSNPAHFFQRPLFIITDSLFNEQWIIPFGVNDSLVGKGLESFQLNDTVFVGVGMLRLEGTVEHSLIMYFDQNGQELGYIEIPNDSIGPYISQNYMNDIERINDSLFMGLTTFGIDNEDFFWGELIIDTSGKIYKQDFRPVGTNGSSKLVKTFDKKYVVGTGLIEGKTDWDIYMYKINEELEQDTIYPGNYTYDSLCPYPIKSGTVDLSDCLIVTDVGETPTPQEYYAGLQSIPITTYPNPVNGDEITFEFQNTDCHSNMKLKVFNVYGELAAEQIVYKYQGAGKMDTKNWKAGMYVALIYSNGKIAGKTKFVVQ